MLVRIMFPDPGFFAVDPKLRVSIDDQAVYEAGFTGGFSADIEVAPGEHRLETAIDLGIAKRKKTYALQVSNGEGVLVATLKYSRFWGNFTRKLDVRVEPPAPSG